MTSYRKGCRASRKAAQSMTSGHTGRIREASMKRAISELGHKHVEYFVTFNKEKMNKARRERSVGLSTPVCSAMLADSHLLKAMRLLVLLTAHNRVIPPI